MLSTSSETELRLQQLLANSYELQPENPVLPRLDPSSFKYERSTEFEVVKKTTTKQQFSQLYKNRLEQQKKAFSYLEVSLVAELQLRKRATVVGTVYRDLPDRRNLVL